MAQVIGEYAMEVGERADRLRKESEERALFLAEKSLERAADPQRTFVPPPERESPQVNGPPIACKRGKSWCR